jgi:hypothetical protein
MKRSFSFKIRHWGINGFYAGSLDNFAGKDAVTPSCVIFYFDEPGNPIKTVKHQNPLAPCSAGGCNGVCDLAHCLTRGCQ